MARGSSQYPSAICGLCLAFSASLSSSPSIVCGAGEGRLTCAASDSSSEPPSPSLVLLLFSSVDDMPCWGCCCPSQGHLNHSRNNRHCILRWRSSDAPDALLPKPLSDFSCTFSCNALTFTEILRSYTGARSEHQPMMLLRQGGNGQGEIWREKNTGAPETKRDGQASLAAGRSGFKREFISLMCWFQPGYTLHLTNKHRQGITERKLRTLLLRHWDGRGWQREGNGRIHRGRGSSRAWLCWHGPPASPSSLQGRSETVFSRFEHQCIRTLKTDQSKPFVLPVTKSIDQLSNL